MSRMSTVVSFRVSTEVGVLESPLVVSHDPQIEYGHGMM